MEQPERRHGFTGAEFLNVIVTEFSSLLFAVMSTKMFYSPHPLSKSGLKLFYNVNIVYGNLNSENSQDYGQKPQRNCTFMNSASGVMTQSSMCDCSDDGMLYTFNRNGITL
jgi:hypothetical protein